MSEEITNLGDGDERNITIDNVLFIYYFFHKLIDVSIYYTKLQLSW